MPARLRMNIVANPGVDGADLKLWSPTASAINGCGACIDVLNEAGVASASIHTAVRSATIIQSVAIAIEAGAIEFAAAAD